jgi:DnaJ-class molecular chaperone
VDEQCRHCFGKGRQYVHDHATKTCETCAGTGRKLTRFGADLAAMIRGVAHDFNTLNLK